MTDNDLLTVSLTRNQLRKLSVASAIYLVEVFNVANTLARNKESEAASKAREDARELAKAVATINAVIAV